jgi:hypothetical protein
MMNASENTTDAYGVGECEEDETGAEDGTKPPRKRQQSFPRYNTTRLKVFVFQKFEYLFLCVPFVFCAAFYTRFWRTKTPLSWGGAQTAKRFASTKSPSSATRCCPSTSGTPSSPRCSGS